MSGRLDGDVGYEERYLLNLLEDDRLTSDDLSRAMSRIRFRAASPLTLQLEAANAKLREQAMEYLALDQQATEALARAVKAEGERDAALARLDGHACQPMDTAPRDGTFILAVVAPNTTRHLEHQAGRVFVIRHEGKTRNGYDMGWSVYPGYGGEIDATFACWCPIPGLARRPQNREALP